MKLSTGAQFSWLKNDDISAHSLACEHYLAAYHNAFGIPYAIFRICVSYGNVLSDGYSYGTIGFFLRMAREGKLITLHGDGRQRHTFTHVQDVCVQIINVGLCQCAENQIFNVGGEDYTIPEIAESIASRFGVDVKYGQWPTVDERMESGSTIFSDKKVQNLILHLPDVQFKSWVESLDVLAQGLSTATSC